MHRIQTGTINPFKAQTHTIFHRHDICAVVHQRAAVLGFCWSEHWTQRLLSCERTIKQTVSNNALSKSIIFTDLINSTVIMQTLWLHFSLGEPDFFFLNVFEKRKKKKDIIGLLTCKAVSKSLMHSESCWVTMWSYNNVEPRKTKIVILEWLDLLCDQK